MPIVRINLDILCRWEELAVSVRKETPYCEHGLYTPDGRLVSDAPDHSALTRDGDFVSALTATRRLRELLNAVACEGKTYRGHGWTLVVPSEGLEYPGTLYTPDPSPQYCWLRAEQVRFLALAFMQPSWGMTADWEQPPPRYIHRFATQRMMSNWAGPACAGLPEDIVRGINAEVCRNTRYQSLITYDRETDGYRFAPVLKEENSGECT